MTLPFFEPKKMVSVIVAKRGKPDLEAASEMEAPGQEMDFGLKMACEDILQAIEGKSVIGLAKALQAAFQICESAPHEEPSDLEGAGE